MKEGEKLDALVAEKAMGIKRSKRKDLIFNSPNYSTNISDAWKVVEKMIDCGFDFLLIADYKDGNVYYYCEFSNLEEGLGVFAHEAETAPLAICLAAIQAFGEEVDIE